MKLQILLLSMASLLYGEDVFQFPPQAMRLIATKAPLPAYPDEPQRLGKSGKVIISLVLDSNASLTTLEILESDSPEFSRAVSSALKQWRFAYKAPMKPDRVIGKLVFYFTISKGRAIVVDAAAAEITRVLGPEKVPGY